MNAVIYARVSSVGDRQNTERQISDLSEYAAFQKLQISQIYEEKISGAKKNRERPVLIEAIEYCKENKVSFAIFTNNLEKIPQCLRDILRVIQ